MKLIHTLPVLLVLGLASARGSEPVSTSILGDLPFPPVVAGAAWIQVTNYGHDGGTGGIGVSYRSPRFKTDIYVYEAGDAALLDHPVAERLEAEIVNIDALMREMERRGHYTDIAISPREEVAIGSRKFVCVKISYTETGKGKKSRYCLSSYRDRVLKIRITGETGLGEDALDQTFAEAAAPFSAD